uniref:Uncharacterized protein n=1 Tax=Arundo donax TaxID=35708 RepID=A0A0A9BBD4_ARUDO
MWLQLQVIIILFFLQILGWPYPCAYQG